MIEEAQESLREKKKAGTEQIPGAAAGSSGRSLGE